MKTNRTATQAKEESASIDDRVLDAMIVQTRALLDPAKRAAA